MKRFIVIIFSIASSLFVYPQYSDFPVGNLDLSKINLEQLKFGIKVSPSIAWLDVKHNNVFAGGATLKFGFGVTAHYEINDIMAIVSAINYNAVGGYMADSLSLGNTNSKDYFKVNYNVIDIPLGLKIKTPTINNYNYYLQGGVSTGFVLSANEKHYKAADNSLLKSYDILKDLTSPTVVGYFVGVGTRYTVSDKLKLFAEVNYKNSLTSISNGENYVTDANHLYNKAIEILPANMEFSFGIEF